ncbi:response regulator [Salirhabdus salicampi]|nr:response regulator [Salirhabdus salicampi]
MRVTLSNMLQGAGHEVVGQAVNGNDAIEKYIHLQPDLVTMDITMPELNGIEATKAILKHDPNAKVLMCSAVGQQKTVIEAIQLGAKDFIVKPFDEDRVMDTINQVLHT